MKQDGENKINTDKNMDKMKMKIIKKSMMALEKEVKKAIVNFKKDGNKEGVVLFNIRFIEELQKAFEQNKEMYNKDLVAFQKKAVDIIPQVVDKVKTELIEKDKLDNFRESYIGFIMTGRTGFTK